MRSWFGGLRGGKVGRRDAPRSARGGTPAGGSPRAWTPRLIKLGLALLLALLGAQLPWPSIWGVRSASSSSSSSSGGGSGEPSSFEVTRGGAVMLAFDQILLPVNAYARTGDKRDQDDFERSLRRFHEAVGMLETGADGKTREIAEAFRSHVSRAEELGRQVVAVRAPQADDSAKAALAQLGAVRNEALWSATELRELDEQRRVAQKMEGVPSGALGGGAIALAGFLAIGGGLARFVVA